MPADNHKYEYDVFFSHGRDAATKEWVAKVVATVSYWLGLELADRDSKIFLDYDGIDVGERWPDALSMALRRSKMHGSSVVTCLFSIEMVHVGVGEFSCA